MKELSILISTNRPYELFAKRVIDSLFEQDMTNNEIVICHTPDIVIEDDRVVLIEDKICINGPQGYNQAAQECTGEYIVGLTDDEYPPLNINSIKSSFNNEYFKDKEYKVATLATGPYPAYTEGPRTLMCRFFVLTRDTLEKLNYYVFHPSFNLKTPHHADHWLSIFLHLNGCPCVELPLHIRHWESVPSGYKVDDFAVETGEILRTLVTNYKIGDTFV